MKTRSLIAAVAVAVATLVPATAASAGTIRLATYDTEMQGYMNNSSGSAELWRYRVTGYPQKTWASQLQMTGLPKGSYTYSIQYGFDTDRNGSPEKFKLVPVCRFYSNGPSTAAGCGADVKIPKSARLSMSTGMAVGSYGAVAIGNFDRR